MGEGAKIAALNFIKMLTEIDENHCWGVEQGLELLRCMLGLCVVLIVSHSRASAKLFNVTVI